MYSKVNTQLWAKAGKKCRIKRKNVKDLCYWIEVLEEILRIELELEKHWKTTIIVVYGLNKDETAVKKNEFW